MRLISFKFNMMLDTFQLYIFTPVSMTFTFYQGQGLRESKIICTHFLAKTSVFIFSENFSVSVDES